MTYRYAEDSPAVIVGPNGERIAVNNRNPEYVALIDAGTPIEPWIPPTPQPALSDVYAERERRLALPMTYDFEDARGVHILAMTRADMQGWQEVTNGAQALLAAGDTTTTFRIYTETGHADVTAPEWMAIVAHSITVRQPIWDAAAAIEALDPIPEDYADDSRWP